MADRILRAAIVGAATLLGKELAAELNNALTVWDVLAFGEEDAAGMLTAAGGEALLVQQLRPDSFEGVDVVFFAGTPQLAMQHWKDAVAKGARVVDSTRALEGQKDVLVRSPWIGGGSQLELTTPVVVPAHPAAVILALVATPLVATFSGAHLAATVLEPASQQGAAGLDEMHQQTLGLLGFKEVPRQVYDAQIAFNLGVDVGTRKDVSLDQISGTIRRHFVAITSPSFAGALALQLVQAPVFHGYTLSVYVELPGEVDAEAVTQAIASTRIEIARKGETPSNQNVTGETILTRVEKDPGARQGTSGFWLWMAADNLRLAARQAVDCGRELVALRPRPGVQ